LEGGVIGIGEADHGGDRAEARFGVEGAEPGASAGALCHGAAHPVGGGVTRVGGGGARAVVQFSAVAVAGRLVAGLVVLRTVMDPFLGRGVDGDLRCAVLVLYCGAVFGVEHDRGVVVAVVGLLGPLGGDDHVACGVAAVGAVAVCVAGDERPVLCPLSGAVLDAVSRGDQCAPVLGVHDRGG